jgi:hypothetical protein
MGISADGKIFSFVDRIGSHRKIILQRLNHAGSPVQAPVVALRGKFAPADISNRINRDQRFLLYHQNVVSPKLFLQVLDANSLQAVGDPDRLAVSTRFGTQTAAIDPFGRFVLYVTDITHPLGESMLLFQALDALGRKSGQPKIIADRVNSGLDVLKE